MQAYDIIGDIHGQAKELKGLLEEMGYLLNDEGVYVHATRKVIYLGDFIDRGSRQKETLGIVRSMIDADSA